LGGFPRLAAFDDARGGVVSILVELGHATVLFSERAEGDLGRTVGEPSAEVLANRAAVLERCGVRAISVPRQVHGSVVAAVEVGEGYVVGLETADGVTSSSPDVAVAVHVADCLPIAITGPGGVAMVHAGWRGLAGGVVASGVATLGAAGVSGPLEAVIGPGARACCYETGPEVHAVFARYGPSHDRRLDLAAIATAQLRAAGVGRVADVGLCTLCAPSGLLFSHRRDGDKTGRQAGIAWLR
jgi:YfiH family protein